MIRLTRADFVQDIANNNLGWRLEYQVSGLAVDAIAKAQLKKVVEMLDGIENPYDKELFVWPSQQAFKWKGFNEAIQTIKRALEGE